MVEWTTDKPKRRRKYRPMLASVKAEQGEHPLAWAEIARFRIVSSGHACVHQLKMGYSDEGFILPPLHVKRTFSDILNLHLSIFDLQFNY